jgi:hypothetical protein
VQPVGRGQLHPGDGVQHLLALAESGLSLRGERGHAVGVTAELGEVSTRQRDRYRDIHQQARRFAHRRLEGLIGRIRERALRGIKRNLARFHVRG